jgi:5-methylcytosine-specific restriction protein A
MRTPAWTEDELLLAGALVVRNGWKELRTNDRAVQELSELLRSLPLHGPEARSLHSFRSPDSVSRKTTDFMTNHPHYKGKATRCGRPTLLMIDAFMQREADMLQAAQTIENLIASGDLHLLAPQPGEVNEDGVAAVEGRLLARWALSRERDPKLRKLKIEQVLQEGQPLRCEVCAFDFGRAYGALGDGYIEVHHVTPLHVSGTRTTRLEDLACLCANCHRMCHRSRPGESWRTPEAVRDEMEKAAQTGSH